MKYLFTCFIMMALKIIAVASPISDSLVKELNSAIKQAEAYDNKKLEEIARLRRLLTGPSNSDLARQYEINHRLYEAYKYYNYDSAFNYTRKLRKYAEFKNDPSLLADAKIKQVFILLSGGMFKETFDSLAVITMDGVAAQVRAEYFSLKARCYYDLGDFDDDAFHTPFYYTRANSFIDSALTLYPPNSFEFLYFSGLRDLKKGKTDSALLQLQHLITIKNLSYHETALVTSMIGGIFVVQGNRPEARNFLIRASIADIKSSTKETSALLSVASIIFKEGNIQNAALFIEKANADASFYKARLRKVQIGAILPLIKEELIKTIETQKQKLIIYLVLLGFLVLLLAGFIIIVRNQVQKLKVARLSLLEQI
ncbi:MAG: DUF6377 domain-containing protein [Ferruginibacter sp.]